MPRRLIFGVVSAVVPPAIVDEDSSPSQLSVREGARVSLVCRARAVPAARVSWKREDGRNIVDGKGENASVVRRSGTSASKPFTAALYCCARLYGNRADSKEITAIGA